MCRLEETSVDTANNRSLVAWMYQIEETTEWGSFSGAGANAYMFIDGAFHNQNPNFGYDFRNYNTLVLASASYWFTHGSDGKKTIAAEAHVGGSTTIGQATATCSLVLTNIARTPSAPGAPGVSGIGVNKFTLTWNAPAANGSAIDDYRIQFAANAAFTSGVSTPIEMNSTLRSYVSDFNVPRSAQYARVQAHNAQGWGPYSAPTPLIQTHSGWYIGQGGVFVPMVPMVGVGGAYVERSHTEFGYDGPSGNRFELVGGSFDPEYTS